MPLSGIPLKGAHNVENVLAAVCAARLAGASAEQIRSGIESFRRSSIAWSMWPPSTAWSFTTTPRPPTWMRRPRRSLVLESGIHLILGGKDKNSDYTQLAQLLRARVRAVYTIGSAAAKIESQLRGVVSILSCETLDHAVKRGGFRGAPGEVVLLAPACSSFDQFENYEQRGRVFKELVSERRGWKVWQHA
jgi:UDP-N-acetylmuramoylalanine--D-glutamate ligase